MSHLVLETVVDGLLDQLHLLRLGRHDVTGTRHQLRTALHRLARSVQRVPGMCSNNSHGDKKCELCFGDKVIIKTLMSQEQTICNTEPALEGR